MRNSFAICKYNVYVIMKSCRKESVVSSWQQNCTKPLLPHMWYFLMAFFVWVSSLSCLLHHTLHHLDARVHHNNRLRCLYWKPSKFKEEACGNLLLACISVRRIRSPRSWKYPNSPIDCYARTSHTSDTRFPVANRLNTSRHERWGLQFQSHQ